MRRGNSLVGRLEKTSTCPPRGLRNLRPTRASPGAGRRITSKNIETPYGLLNSTKADQLPSVQFEESARSMLSDTHRELASNYGA
mmetsp:Transcript_33833/g.107408  ORF Transcript_33833/g.107408 Transcript_33833/m.107408 type:complete len:85 (+) Transcript_33833:616-870(+)